MSMDLMVQAMKTKVGNPLRKLVLLKLADNASDKGECWPSYQHIADQCEISKRSVMSHIEALCEMGLVRKEYRKGPKGNSTNIYHLHLCSAGGSLGGSAGAAPHSAARSLGSAGDSLGGSAGAAPRISHSLEPVIEPVIEPKSIGTSAKAAEPSRNAKQDYSPEFEEAWKIYPSREGGNNKQAAWKAWKARLKQGYQAADMVAGVERYAAHLSATGTVGTRFVKQASTFFGPDCHFAEEWHIAEKQPEPQSRPYAYQDTESSEIFLNLDAMRSDQGNRWRQ